jgi:hypothetical protein
MMRPGRIDGLEWSCIAMGVCQECDRWWRWYIDERYYAERKLGYVLFKYIYILVFLRDADIWWG